MLASNRSPSIPARPYPFLPPSLARGAFLIWLRRIHAWLGLWGAVLGLMFGLTGILLNHKRDFLKFSLDSTTRTKLELPVPPEARHDLQAFRAWFTAQLPRPYKVYAKQEVTNGTTLFKVHALAPHLRIEAHQAPGDAHVTIDRRERDLLGTLNALHQAGGGMGAGWVLLADSIAGAFFVLTLTGLLLWSKLDGPRLLAIGLGTGGLVIGTVLVLKYTLIG